MFRIDYPFKRQILACGLQGAANFCLTKKNCGYIINDLGSLDEDSVFERYQSEIERLSKELKIKAKVISHDLDPEEAGAKYAQTLSRKAKGLKCFPAQHHLAHIASCLGENALRNRVIGVVFDGPALGADGRMWGGEFFVGGLEEGFKRAAHLKYTPLPGENAAKIEPWQLAASFLYQAFGENFVDLEIDFIRCREKEQWHTFRQNWTNYFYTSSAADLFDCVCLLMGLREKIDYAGQGAVDLERIVNRSSHVAGKTYEFDLKKENDKLLINYEAVFGNIVKDLKNNISKSIISATFHNTVIEMVGVVCQKIMRSFKVKDVVLAGSVFQNKFLFRRLEGLLSENGFQVITHRHFTYSDNNISFGQAILADSLCR